VTGDNSVFAMWCVCVWMVMVQLSLDDVVRPASYLSTKSLYALGCQPVYSAVIYWVTGYQTIETCDAVWRIEAWSLWRLRLPALDVPLIICHALCLHVSVITSAVWLINW